MIQSASGGAAVAKDGALHGVRVLKIGDKVEKISGYKWPGVIVSVFETTKGETRIVVECTVPEVAGALHIFNPKQLRLCQPTAAAG